MITKTVSNETKLRHRLETFRAACEERCDPAHLSRKLRIGKRAAEQLIEEMEGEGIPSLRIGGPLNTRQAAWVLGVIERLVRAYCGQGRLGYRDASLLTNADAFASKVAIGRGAGLAGTRWSIDKDDLLRFADLPRPVGAKARAQKELEG
jgi:hypothetical protein